MKPLVRLVVAAALLASLGACSWMPTLKFWDSGPDVDAGEVKVRELRRSLLCGTPTEAAVVRYFPTLEALTAWDTDNILHLGRIELPTDRAFVLVEQGRRQTGGYSIELRKTAQVDEQGVLRMSAEWLEPGEDRMVTQIITSLCVLASVKPEPYSRVELVDKNGTFRAGVDIAQD